VEQQIGAVLVEPQSIESAEQRGLVMAASTTDAVFVGHPLYCEIRLSQCGPLRLKRLRGRVADTMAKTEDADLLRLGLLWLESDLQPNAEVLTQAAKIAASRIDVGLAERLARGAASARAGPDTHLRPIQFAVTSLAHTWVTTGRAGLEPATATPTDLLGRGLGEAGRADVPA
jgi:hypothetical protein